MSPPRLKGFWLTLQRFDWAEVEHALSEAMTRKWYPFPQPADLIALIEGNPDDRAELTWGHLWDYFNHGGSTYDSLYCEDALVAECIRVVFGGWLQAGLCPRPDADDPEARITYQTYHKTWVQTYKALAHQRRGFEGYLPGRRELEGMVRIVDGHVLPFTAVTMLERTGERAEIGREEVKKLQGEAVGRRALGPMPEDA
jgi:hypothetical protein